MNRINFRLLTFLNFAPAKSVKAFELSDAATSRAFPR